MPATVPVSLELVRPRVAALAATCDAIDAPDPRTEPLVGDLLALCRELAADFEADEPEVADVAFVATVDLRNVHGRLVGPMSDDAATEEQGRALRHVLRTLGALEQVLGMPPRQGGARERSLARSIATRRRYASLRRSILVPNAPTDAAAMAHAFARVRIQMMLLVTSDVYAVLRRTDRAQIDELMMRLTRALALGDAGDVREGERLWQDLAGFARLTSAISRRHELVESDTRIIDEASEWLTTANEIPTRLRVRLDMLAGLDDEIDALFETYSWDAAAWREALAVLHERLVRPATGRFARVPIGPR